MLAFRALAAGVVVAGCGAGASAPDSGLPPDGGSCPSSVDPAPGLVVTDRGPVQGIRVGETWAYLGVPYAAPPVGDLRWSAPTAHACWSTPWNASGFGSACMQIQHGTTTVAIGDENCLDLNVWAPANATSDSARPVLVFLHGGANIEGAASDAWGIGNDAIYVYGGSELAAKTNTIVVTLDYRLGALGFLAHPAFGAHAGNYGLLDQIFALRWVQTNIAGFGGDPARVLLFGQSAGAADTCVLIASPLTKGMMSAALMESGSCTAVESAADAHAFAQTFAQTSERSHRDAGRRS